MNILNLTPDIQPIFLLPLFLLFSPLLVLLASTAVGVGVPCPSAPKAESCGRVQFVGEGTGGVTEEEGEKGGDRLFSSFFRFLPLFFQGEGKEVRKE